MKEINKDFCKNKDELMGEIEENILPPDNIVVMNEVRSASDLFRLMKGGSTINIQPDFQREEVWSPDMRARFIDSLSKEFPIPSMCFALDPKEQKYIVIDGLQRMSTIKKFLDDSAWILPKLNDIDKKISGKSVGVIREKNPEIFRKIENVSLPVTILRYDPKRKDNMEYIFTIFQRLNTFGERLNNQEIRNSIYQGSLNSFLRECAKERAWISIFQKKKNSKNNRMSVEEGLLRFFAFHEDLSRYDGKLNKFLNEFMQKNRHADNSDRAPLFFSVTEIIEKLGPDKIEKRSNAFRDAFLYGISENIKFLENKNTSDLKIFVKKLEEDEHFSVEALSSGIMQKTKVQNRLAAAKIIFSGK